jgi:hypothetical protein
MMRFCLIWVSHAVIALYVRCNIVPLDTEIKCGVFGLIFGCLVSVRPVVEPLGDEARSTQKPFGNHSSCCTRQQKFSEDA